MTPERELLKNAIEKRAVELRLRLNRVAKRADMSEANFFRIRTGEVALTPFSTAAIEDALDWEHGSIQAILDGGEPTPRRGATPPTPPGITPQEWASFRPAEREEILAIKEAARARREQQTADGRKPGSAA